MQMATDSRQPPYADTAQQNVAPTRERRWGWLLVPALLMLVLVFLLPTIMLAARSLHASMGPGQESAQLQLTNYTAFLSDPFYWHLLGNTSLLGALVSGVSLALALPLSYFLARTRSRWRSPLLLIVIAPMLVSVVIRNLGWLTILGNQGLINWLLIHSGATQAPVPLINNLTGVVIGLVHALLPFMILTLTTVLQRIDPALEEASISLGVPPLMTFWRVVVPLALPGIVAGCLLVFGLTISAYTTPALMGGGRIVVMATYIQQQISTLLDYARGATASVILVVWVCALSIISMRLGKTGEQS
jgi:putative spermidine/putrescine transport system permease protein